MVQRFLRSGISALSAVELSRVSGFIRGAAVADHPSPLEFGLLEVQEEGDIQAGDAQVTQHLGDVRIGERGDDFWVGDDRPIDDDVGDQFSDPVAAIVEAGTKRAVWRSPVRRGGRVNVKGPSRPLSVPSALSAVKNLRGWGACPPSAVVF